MTGDELPTGWRWATIREIATYVQRGKSPKYAPTSALPVINQKCVRWTGVEAEHVKFVDPEQWDSWSDDRTLRDGDILWNSTGTGTIGRAAIYRPLPGFARVVADSHVTVIRLDREKVLPEFVHAWIRSPTIQGRIDAMQSGSTNQVELGRSEVLATRLPLPPLAQQRRIVQRVEAADARRRRARAALDQVPQLLEKLRQSILAAAFRGDLTKDWREAQRRAGKEIEPASELLKRIRAERRAKWEEAELAKMKAKGKAPADARWKAKYKEPAPVDVTGLPALPDGWTWATVEELSTKVVDGVHSKPSYVSLGIPFLTVKNLTATDSISFDDVKYVTREDHLAFSARAKPERFDLLISKDGTLGVTRLIRTDATFSIFVSLALVKPVLRDMSEYLEVAFWSPYFQERFKATGSGLQHIHLVDLRRAALPIAPVREQVAVVAAARASLLRIAAARAQLASLEAAISRFDHAVLRNAFAGALATSGSSD